MTTRSSIALQRTLVIYSVSLDVIDEALCIVKKNLTLLFI